MKIKSLRVLIIVTIFISIVSIGSGIFIYNDMMKREEVSLNVSRNRESLIKDENVLIKIKSNYSSVVRTTKDTKLYINDNGEYIDAGSINKDNILELETIDNISLDNKYFKLLDSDYYVSYKDVEPSDESINKRYLNYIEFSIEVTTKESAIYYDENFNELFTLKDPITTKVVVNLDDYYGISLLSRLVYVKKEDVSNTVEVDSSEDMAVSVPAILYHFIYLDGDSSCNDIICHSEEQIDSHFKFLSDNDVFTLNTSEVLSFIKGEINLPKKSILITIDDGARAENFIPFLEKYQLNATLFLVSSWYPVSKFQSPYLEIASHTHNMHTTGVCPTGQGGGINCLPSDEILNDLKLSRETLNNTKAFCFPFYEYSNYSINLVKEAGFEMAFIGGSTKIKKGINPYKIPRYPILSSFNVDYISNLVLG
ncbi:MAG TPA: polysaccharide deacetylase family protein [Candidatus Onthousia faecipullorum]|uniref:Polysaccharide deacetylase family protein n=1 Tax=Candidatus Onthousia faecipullorum TaxID=2840887 RepID=A0A9D1G9Z7_9FIRM|nr:polysaccharide deacetylase family protein [Candidatus Onthousia faecipullorum]